MPQILRFYPGGASAFRRRCSVFDGSVPEDLIGIEAQRLDRRVVGHSRRGQVVGLLTATEALAQRAARPLPIVVETSLRGQPLPDLVFGAGREQAPGRGRQRDRMVAAALVMRGLVRRAARVRLLRLGLLRVGGGHLLVLTLPTFPTFVRRLRVRACAGDHQRERRDQRKPHFPPPLSSPLFAPSLVGCALGGPSSFFKASLICSTLPCGFSAVGGGRCVKPDEIPSTKAFRTTPST